MKTYLSHMFLSLAVCFIPVDGSSFIFDLVSKKHVFTDGKQWDQCKLLVNNNDTFCLAVIKLFKLTLFTLVGNRSSIAAVWILTT